MIRGQIRFGVALLASAVALPGAAQELLSQQRWQSVHAQASKVDVADAAATATHWLVKTGGDPILRELMLDRAARALAMQAPGEQARGLLAQIAAEPATSLATLEDAGRTIAVPAFSAASTARAALQSWQQQDLQAAAFAAIQSRDFGALQSLLTEQAGGGVAAVAAAIASLDARLAPAQWLRSVGLPQHPRLQLALAQVERTPDAYARWLRSLPGQTDSASGLQAGLRAMQRDLAPEESLPLLVQATKTPGLAGLALREVGQLAATEPQLLNSALATLAAALTDPAHGHDAAHALAGLGEQGITELVAAAYSAERQRAAAGLNGLRLAGAHGALAKYLQDDTRPADMRRQAQAWLAP